MPACTRLTTRAARLAPLATLVLAACALPRYTPPPAEATAYLRVAPPIVGAHYYADGERCGPLLMLDEADDPIRRPDRTFAAPAGRRVAMGFGLVQAVGSCFVTMSFVLQAGQRYEARMRVVGNRCYAAIFEEGKDAKATAEDIALKQLRPAAIGSSCAGQ